MSLDDLGEDALRELELWPLVALQRGGQPPRAPALSAGERLAAAGPTPETSRAEPVSRPEVAPDNVRRPAPVMGVKESAPAAFAKPVPRSIAGLGVADWSALKDLVAHCDACGLCKQRKQAVFGTGSETGPWLFVGEGPGADEDAQGEPFVGQAGKLLDAMLASIGLSRKQNAYIANVVKCRPPGNRTPTLDEAAACAEYLDRQIDLVSPKLIVALGKTAATRLIGHEASLASLRGKLHTYRGYPVLITYHPAYLLRNLPDKAKAWEDLVMARRIFAEQK